MDNFHQLHPTAVTKITALKRVNQGPVQSQPLLCRVFLYRCNRSDGGCRQRRHSQGRESQVALLKARLGTHLLVSDLDHCESEQPRAELGTITSAALSCYTYHASLCSQKHLLTATPEQIAVLLLPGKLPALFSPSPASRPWCTGRTLKSRATSLQAAPHTARSPQHSEPPHTLGSLSRVSVWIHKGGSKVSHAAIEPPPRGEHSR